MPYRRFHRLILLSLLAPLALALALWPVGCSSSNGGDGGIEMQRDEAGKPMSIHAVLAADPRFETFVGLVDESLFNDDLTYNGYFTVFAPTEDAFRHMSAGEIAALRRPEARSRLKAFVATHIVEAWMNFDSDEYVGPPGRHVADGPIPVPQRLETRHGHEIAVRVGELQVQVDGATCPRIGLACSNGWIYPLSEPLEPPREVNMLSRLAEDGRFTRLLAAIVKAELLTWLRRRSVTEWTLLAPTDAAIDRLPPGTWREWLADREALRAVLTRHVIPGIVDRQRLSELPAVTTIDGQRREVTDTAGSIRVQGVELDPAPLPATDGIIHPVNAFLPETTTDD